MNSYRSKGKGGLPAQTLVILLVLGVCGSVAAEESGDDVLPAVEALTVQPQILTVSSELPGRIEPVRAAEVRARVAGIVLSKQFEEGADVEGGDILFEIDSAPFRAALLRAEGQLAQAEAALLEAQAVIRRYEPLIEIDAISQQVFDTAKAELASARAVRQSAQAEVETAELNLGYATVKAPISGRIGRALVTEGAMVGQDEATSLALIQQLDPVYVDFKQPVSEVARLRAAQTQEDKNGNSAISISLTPEMGREKRDGQLLFSDVTVDRGTGQVTLRGIFPNEDGVLLPGMYVRVNLNYSTDAEAVLIPQRAILIQDDGSAQVLVVDEGGFVEERPVEVGSMYGSQWHITRGLTIGERVIVGGMSNPEVAPGSRVRMLAAPRTANNTSN